MVSNDRVSHPAMPQIAIISSDTAEVDQNKPLTDSLAALLKISDSCLRRLEFVYIAAAAASASSNGPQRRRRLLHRRRSLQHQVARLQTEFHSIASRFAGILSRVDRRVAQDSDGCLVNNNDAISTLDEASSDTFERQTTCSVGSTGPNDPTAATTPPGEIGYAIAKRLAKSRRILDRLATRLLALQPSSLSSPIAKRRSSAGNQQVVVRLSMRFRLQRETKSATAAVNSMANSMKFGDIAFQREIGSGYPLWLGAAKIGQKLDRRIAKRGIQ